MQSKLLLEVRSQVIFGLVDALWRLARLVLRELVDFIFELTTLRHILHRVNAVEVREVVGARVQTNIKAIIKLTYYLVARLVELRE